MSLYMPICRHISIYLYINIYLYREPANLLFLESACSLYHTLVEDRNGKSFLFSDLRHMVFHEMSRELELVLQNSGNLCVYL
jgi:hypothetical protein